MAIEIFVQSADFIEGEGNARPSFILLVWFTLLPQLADGLNKLLRFNAV